jgi:hypothetical protein
MTATAEFIGTSQAGRSLYFSALANLDEWPPVIEEPRRYFVLFLALDATDVPEGVIRGFAEKLAAQGVGYVCAWGPECSWVHDIFDFALYVDNEKLHREQDEHDATVMTSWHADEGLDEALYFAVFNAYPDEHYSRGSDALIAVVVDSPAWASHVRRRLGETDALLEDVLAREPEHRRLDRLRTWVRRRRTRAAVRRIRRRHGV